MKDFCLEIELRYQLKSLGIGTGENHAHFLVKAVSGYSATKVVTIIKSLRVKEIFHLVTQMNDKFWGGELWTVEYDASVVGKHGHEAIRGKYGKLTGDELYANH